MTRRDVERPANPRVDPPGAATGTATSTAADRQAFYDRLSPHSLAPLWEVLRDIVPPEPRSRTVAHLWRYRDLRPLLVESGELLSAEEAERRVLVLENPALPGQSRATATLYSACCRARRRRPTATRPRRRVS